MHTILVIEDYAGDAEALRQQLAATSFQASFTCCGTLGDGLQRLMREKADLALLDLNLPDSRGLTSYVRLQNAAPDMPVIIVSGIEDLDISLQCIKAGAQDYLIKGAFDALRLQRSILYAFERHAIRSNLETLAWRDELTGLHNRRGLFASAVQLMETAKRLNKNLMLFYIDIDTMKAVNDQYGHVNGDRAIQAVATILRNTARAADIVARIGGDEFAVLGIGNDSSKRAYASRLQAVVRHFNADRKLPFKISISIGHSAIQATSNKQFTYYIERADKNMYAKKSRNKKHR